jgi:hypothetical protein
MNVQAAGAEAGRQVQPKVLRPAPYTGDSTFSSASRAEKGIEYLFSIAFWWNIFLGTVSTDFVQGSIKLKQYHTVCVTTYMVVRFFILQFLRYLKYFWLLRKRFLVDADIPESR